jgi:hypothetical protein
MDELRQSVAHAVSHTGDDHAAVAVAHEDHVSQVLVVENGHDVPDVGVEVCPGIGPVRAFTEAGE